MSEMTINTLRLIGNSALLLVYGFLALAILCKYRHHLDLSAKVTISLYLGSISMNMVYSAWDVSTIG